MHVELPGLEEFVLESGALAAVEEITFRSVCVATNSSIDLPEMRELQFERDLYFVKIATLESRNGETRSIKDTPKLRNMTMLSRGLKSAKRIEIRSPFDCIDSVQIKRGLRSCSRPHHSPYRPNW